MALRADDVHLGRDRVLVESFQAGDNYAFDDLYRRYFGRLFRYCLRRVGDRHEAEELAQEAFTRAYRALPSLQGDRRFYPWLTVIAGRLCVDSHRRRFRTEPSDSIDLGAVDGGQDRVIDAADAALLNLALERLTASHREVLKLREHEEWSYQHIADHLGVTLGTVEARLFRARQALRREFTALAGPDSGLAAVPVLGWLVRKLASARARVGAWSAAANLGPALGGAIAAATLVVGSVGAYSVGHPTVAGGAAAMSRQHVGVQAVLGPDGRAIAANPSSSARAAALVGGPSSAQGGRGQSSFDVTAGGMTSSPAHRASPSDAQQQAAQAPVSQTVTVPGRGDVTASVNPPNALYDTVDEATNAPNSVESKGASK